MEASWNQPLIRAQAGDLVLYYGRLAEVISPGAKFNPAILDVTDDGGIVHTYTGPHVHKVELLGRPDECVLDDIDRAAGAPRTPEEVRRRIAEQWLAEVHVGDLFRLDTGELLEIVELGEGGGIWAAIGFPLKERAGRRAVAGLAFDGIRRLRGYLAREGRPVYAAQAISTMRPGFQDHELILSHTESPLWTGELPSGQIAQRKQDM